MKLNLNSAQTIKDQKNFKAFMDSLIRLGTKVVYKKDEVVLTEGGRADFMLIVQDVILRTWRLVNDKEVVLGLTFPGDLDTSPVAFIKAMPSKETIDAVCTTTCLKISRTAFFEHIKHLNLPEDVFQFLLLEYIDVLIQRHLDLKAYTAEENYINLLIKQPKLVSKIPIKDAASFLGVSRVC